MIYYLKGEVASLGDGFLIVEVNNIGYKCFADSRTISKLKDMGNKQVKILTEMVVREDAINLYGFLDSKDVDYFKMLTSVSGVGSKVALSILSQFTPDQISTFILSGSTSSLTKAPGLGKKLAQRILLELKDKIGSKETQNSIKLQQGELTNNLLEALKALEALGYQEKDVADILYKLDRNMDVESIIREVLKNIK